jgi:hypothetical protein
VIARRPKGSGVFATVDPLNDDTRREVVGILRKEHARIARRPRQVAPTEAKFTVGAIEVDPVADALDTKPGKVNPRYRKYHDPFMTMIRAATSPYQKKIGVLDTIRDWWSVAFPGRPFPPSKRLTGNEVTLAMQYALLMRGYEQYNIEPPARFKKMHDIAVDMRFGELPDRLQTVLDYDESTTLGKTIIQPQPESEQWQKLKGKSQRQPQQNSARRSVQSPQPKPIARRPRRR